MNKILASLLTILLLMPLSAVAADSASGHSPMAKTETQKEAAADKPVEPITGAFGIILGEPFAPAMVAKVLHQREKDYPGPNGTELTGSLIEVEPSQPDERFQRYSLQTTDQGIVYAIEAEFQIELDKKHLDNAKQSRKIRKTCKTTVKNLAKELEARYGKPRSMGLHGEWFAFRQFSKTTDKSIRLYANQCRTGKYRVVYTDLAITAKRKDMRED